MRREYTIGKSKQRRKRRAFTAEFKAEAGRLCRVGDRSIAQVAEDLDLTETALRSWVKQSEIDAGEGPPEALTSADGRSKRRFKRTTDSKHAGPIAPNVLARQFHVSQPNRARVTDVTAIATDEGWLYLAPMLHLHSRRVVAWSGSDTNDTALALDVLRRALRARRPPPGLLHHSDRGSPYASDDYRAELRANRVRRSMSRKGEGDCWDNAVAESFFATLRAELVDHERYPTRAAAMKSIGDYIDNFYNIERRHSHLNYLNPIEFELRSQLQQNVT